MRISDWSPDVCSSDLRAPHDRHGLVRSRAHRPGAGTRVEQAAMTSRAPFRRPARPAAIAAGCLVLLALAGCRDDGAEADIVARQIGPDPFLPEPSTELLPDMKVAEVVGWQDGETPTVPDGLKITAYAEDLANPRMVPNLPNGHVLVEI